MSPPRLFLKTSHRAKTDPPRRLPGVVLFLWVIWEHVRIVVVYLWWRLRGGEK